TDKSRATGPAASTQVGPGAQACDDQTWAIIALVRLDFLSASLTATIIGPVLKFPISEHRLSSPELFRTRT
ncbi:MAG: hypothetical protein RIR45_486, partial [Pseudomonadota bacterium]